MSTKKTMKALKTEDMDTTPIVTVVSPITTEATVDMNSIVAFFISKHENALYERKKALSKKISAQRKYLEETFLKELAEDIKLSSFNAKIEPLGIDLVASIHQYGDGNSTTDKKTVIIRIIPTRRERNSSIDIYREATMSDELFDKYEDAIAKRDKLRSDLHSVLEQISNVSRKEREIRGKIAEKTLRDAGHGNLFDSPELLSLVTLPTLSSKES